MVATALGVAGIKPPESLPKPQASVIIEEVIADGVPLGRDFVVPANTRRVEIHYNAPTFVGGQRPKFEQRIEGSDNQWTLVSDTRTAQLTRPAPGDYGFHVRLARGYGHSPSEATLRFRVLAPWYQRWPVPVALAMLLAILVFTAFRFRVRQMASRFAAVNQERTRIARDWHDGFAQVFLGISYQLDALKLRLTNQREPGLSPEVASLVAETKAMVKQGQVDVKDVLWDLRAGHDANSFLQEFRTLSEATSKRFGVAVSFRAKGPLPTPGALTSEWPHIAKEAVTNAIKHGQAKRVNIDLDFTPTTATMTIEDDGSGLGAAPTPRSYGIVGMNERAKRCHGVLCIGPGVTGGTVVKVVVDLAAHG